MTRSRRRLRWLAVFLLLVFLGGAFVGGRYVYFKGFTKKWRGFVFEQFRSRGIEVEFEKLTLDPFQGMLARRVKIYDGPQRTAILARIDKLVLDINYAKLLRGKPFLEAVDLTDANLAIPIDPSDASGKKARINNLNARVLFPPGQVYISHASASIYELELQLKGRLANPQAFQLAPAPPGGNEKRTLALTRLLDALEKVRATGEPPRLILNVAGDLAQRETVAADVTLAAPQFEIRGYRVERLRAALRYDRERLVLSRLSAVDRLGRLDARGSYDFATHRAEMNLQCGLDLPELFDALKVTDRLEEIALLGPASLTLAATARFEGEPTFLLTGRVHLGAFRVQAVQFENFGTSFSWDGRRWYLRGSQLRHKTGEVAASGLQTDRFVGRLESSLDPTALLPFTSGKTREFLGEWKFLRTPDLLLRFSGPSIDPAEMVVDGSLRLGRTLFRGQSMQAASATLRVENRAATYSACRIERSEGAATGTFTYDFGQRLVRLENCVSTLNPQEVAPWIARDFLKHVRPYRFRRPPTIRAEGIVYLPGGKGTDLRLHIESPAGMDYTFVKKELPFSSARGDLQFTDGRLRMTNLEAALFGGAVQGSANIQLGRGPQPFSAKIRAEEVAFDALTRLYFDYDSSTGKLSGNFDFKGMGDDPMALVGAGQVRVDDGNVFAIPFLGPLSGIIGKLFPALGYSEARQATATFEIGNGALATDNLQIEGRGFEMVGDGTLFYLTDRINFNIRINARGLPGVILSPVSRLFEYTASGKLSEPEWQAKNLPGI